MKPLACGRCCPFSFEHFDVIFIVDKSTDHRILLLIFFSSQPNQLATLMGTVERKLFLHRVKFEITTARTFEQSLVFHVRFDRSKVLAVVMSKT